MQTVSALFSKKPAPLLLQENISLRDKNWFQTGGAARYFAQPENHEQFQEALAFAQQRNLNIFMLGQGANILISDAGFDGLVIRPKLNAINHTQLNETDVLVEAGAGCTMDNLIEYCLHNNITGLEEFSGIPGTVGGSVFINLHYFQFLLEHFMVDAVVIHRTTGSVESVSKEWFKFGYNTSTLQHNTHYLVSARFKLKRADAIETAYARGRRTEIIRHRVARYPSTHTCGSFFRNFHTDEVPYFIQGSSKKLIFVAYYLDQIGVKGTLSSGGARVSHQHANMLVTSATATSNDVIAVARTMQELVQQKFGVVPQPECQLIGFTHHPLMV